MVWFQQKISALSFLRSMSQCFRTQYSLILVTVAIFGCIIVAHLVSRWDLYSLLLVVLQMVFLNLPIKLCSFNCFFFLIDLNFFSTVTSLSPWPTSYLTLNSYQMTHCFSSELFWIHCNRGHDCLPLQLPWIIDYSERNLQFFIE